MKTIRKYWIAIVGVFFFSIFINPAICIIIVGSFAFYMGISAILFLKQIQNKGIETIGRILFYQTGDKNYKTPIIEFTPADSETVTEKPFVYASTDLSKVRSYSKLIDTEVVVLYDPENPKRFVLAGENSFNYTVFSIFIMVGLFFVVLSVFNFLGYIKFD
jgi:hypothetical protein